MSTGRAAKTAGRKFRDLLVLSGSASAVFGVVCLAKGNERFYSSVVMPSLHRAVEAERAHRMAVWAFKHNLFRGGRGRGDEQDLLKTTAFGLDFPNPVGIAAGFDKHAEAVEGLGRAGFGFVEIGSVTPEPQEGNPRPRVFRLKEDRAVINRYGFNSDGHDVVRERLRAARASSLSSPESSSATTVVGVNLGKNKTSDRPVADYVSGVERLGPVADYLVVNVSSPNTPGLRSLQGRSQLRSLIGPVLEARDGLPGKKVPVLLKVAPDLSEEDKRDIAEVIAAEGFRVDGLVVCNTTVSRPGTLASRHRGEVGGLSGRPLRDASTAAVADFYRLTRGQIPIVGVGGISTGSDAYEKLLAGASLVQVYTALVYQGPPVVHRIRRELTQLLERDGVKSIGEIVGKKAGQFSSVK